MNISVIEESRARADDFIGRNEDNFFGLTISEVASTEVEEGVTTLEYNLDSNDNDTRNFEFDADFAIDPPTRRTLTYTPSQFALEPRSSGFDIRCQGPYTNGSAMVENVQFQPIMDGENMVPASRGYYTHTIRYKVPHVINFEKQPEATFSKVSSDYQLLSPRYINDNTISYDRLGLRSSGRQWADVFDDTPRLIPDVITVTAENGARADYQFRYRYDIGQE